MLKCYEPWVGSDCQRKKRPPTRKMIIATYNLKSLNIHEKRYKLENVLTKIKWDIVGFSKVKRKGKNSIKFQPSRIRVHLLGNNIEQNKNKIGNCGYGEEE